MNNMKRKLRTTYHDTPDTYVGGIDKINDSAYFKR